MKALTGLAVMVGAFAGSALAVPQWMSMGGIWESSFGGYMVTVDPAKAGKITKFRYKGLDAIKPLDVTKPDVEHGAFFWPAPQHRWQPTANWPPPHSFTDSAYKASLDVTTGAMILVGPPNPYTKLRVTKRFSFDTVANSFVLTYATTNTATDSARHFAPWEISRGFSGSLLFFPKATKFKFVNPTGSGLRPDLPLAMDDSLGWYLDDGKYNDNKFFRDGAEGWLAQLKDSLLFVKNYEDVDSARFAPWESDIEGYTSGSFIENEVLGPWTAIKPGDSLVWTVRWSCAILPKSANLQVGSADLKSAARQLAKSATASARPRANKVRILLGTRPLVDARGRLLPKSDRALKSGDLGVLPLR